MRVPDTLIGLAKKELTLSILEYGQQIPRRINVWWKVENQTTTLHVPRFWLQEKLGTSLQTPSGTSLQTPYTGVPVSFESIVRLRDDLDQVKAMAATMHSIRTIGGAVLSLGTGQGKTVCACHAIAELGTKTMVIVHKDVLKTQWTERIRQFLPHATISYVQGQSLDTSGDIVIAMLQTLIIPGKKVDVSDIGLVVVDECHHIAAETFSTAMRLFDCRYFLGLSATPKRKDSLTNVIHWFLGPLAYAAQRREMKHVTVDCRWYASDRYHTEPLPTNRLGNVDFAKVMTSLASDPIRTKFVADLVNGVLAKEPKRQVLVLSHRRQHCQDLAALIPGAAVFVGKPRTKKKTVEDTAHLTAPVVCATFSLASEGYDDPRLDTLVLATPCSDVTQAAGRILRGVGGDIDPLIVDVCDRFSLGFSQAAKRKGYYRKAGFRFLPLS